MSTEKDGKFAERFQSKWGHTWIGSRAIGLASGSSSPAYRQLDWRTAGSVSAKSEILYVSNGDSEAGMWRRKWQRAAVIAMNMTELEYLVQDYSNHIALEAVAYRANGQIHVGYDEENNDILSGSKFNNRVSIAMRIGKGPLEASAGLWLPEDQLFVGARHLNVVHEGLYITNLPHLYPTTALV